ncbi:hypothetical protein [Rhodococcus koreensis]|uniref:hypothetical protein n=1 Tax=Rhodococcus koreensis TaxID=99653 RepID=UPI003670C031
MARDRSIGIALVAHYLLEAPDSRSIYALGANPVAARLVGLRNELTVRLHLRRGGVLAAVGRIPRRRGPGLLKPSRAGGANPRIGPRSPVRLRRGVPERPPRSTARTTWRDPRSGYFLAVINNGLNLVGVHPYDCSFVNGAALIAGIGLATSLGRTRHGELPTGEPRHLEDRGPNAAVLARAVETRRRLGAGLVKERLGEQIVASPSSSTTAPGSGVASFLRMIIVIPRAPLTNDL